MIHVEQLPQTEYKSCFDSKSYMQVPLYKHIADLAGKTTYHLPVPAFTLISGGNQGGNNLAIQVT